MWSGRILKATGKPESLIDIVTDRPGHDRRYALTNEKLTHETGWQPAMILTRPRRHGRLVPRKSGVDPHVKSGEYRRFYELNYKSRG